MTKLYRILLSGIMGLLFCSASALAQNKLFMNPIKYTDRLLAVYKSTCGSSSQIHLYINDQVITSDHIHDKFFVGEYYAFELDFGLMKPGDVFKVKDDCGSISFQQTVKDDYVYVEVPSGQGHAGNGIGPNDEYAPYTKLSTPLTVGKCSPLTIDSHALINYFVFSPETNGTFKINGAPLTDGPTGLNPGGYDINFNGYQGTPTYAINPDGSIQCNTSIKLESNTHYSGQIPIVMEYVHGGQNVNGDLSFGFAAMAIRQVTSSGCVLQKASLGGASQSISFSGTPASVYKVTYDGVYYRAYIDNVLIDEMHRFVEYASSSGTLSPSSAAGLDYSTPVSWTGMQTGSQWVSILVDGVLYTRQYFNVADDLVIGTPAVTDVACSGGSSGSITVNTSGGLAPLQYALDNGSYSSTNNFSNLAPGTYNIHVRDASGCQSSRTATIQSAASLSVSVVSKTDETCSGSANGSVMLQASGGTGPYLFSKDESYYDNNAGFSALAAGAYSFIVRDDNGCQASVKDTVRSSGNLVAVVTDIKNVNCFGGQTGAFRVNTSGSSVNGQLQYSLDNGVSFQAQDEFQGLSAGTYEILVKDDACTVKLSTALNQPQELVIQANMEVPISCFGRNDATIAGNASLGTAPYQYSIDGVQYLSSGTFSGIGKGNYKIWAKDANGCVKESSIVNVDEPTQVVVSVLDKTDLTCFESNDGAVTLAAQGGIAPYSFSRDGTAYDGGSSFTSLPAGTVNYFIKDDRGCEANVAVELLQPPVIVVSAANTITVSCYGGNNGQITASAFGGTGTLQYAVDGGSFQSSGVFGNMAAGDYVITVQDLKGCKKESAPLSVAQASQIKPTVEQVNVKCYGGNDATVKMSATGGTGAYLYSKDGQNFQTASLFSGLSASDLTFSVKDANECVVSQDVKIMQPDRLAATATVAQHVLCYEGKSGIIDADASGGVSPYQYAINSSSFQSTESFSLLGAGSYIVKVKDANGCQENAPVASVTEPDPLVPYIVSQTAVKCHNGNDAKVILAADGGVGPYLYSSDSSSYQSSGQFNNLQGGASLFTVKDEHGCTKTIAVQIAQPQNPYRIELASQTNLTCNNQQIGRIEIENKGGTGPYLVSLDNTNFQDDSVFPNLSAGTYIVYGKDANSCTYRLSDIKLTQPTEIKITLTRKKDVDCEYYTKGEAQIEAIGSNENFTYTLTGADFNFQQINPTVNTTGYFDNLKAGDYTVTAKDPAGCSAEFPVTIVPKSTNITFEVSKVLPTSCSAEDGSITISNINGGRAPYQYGISSQNSFSTSPYFEGLLNGSYIVTVSDELCSYRKSVDLSIPNSIRAEYTIDPVSCLTPAANLRITDIAGGNGNYLLSLNGGAPGDERVFENLHPNVYHLVIQDNPLSCKTAVGIEIKEQNRADLQIVSRQNILCNGENSGAVTLKGDNNLSPFIYAVGTGTYSDNPVFSGLSVGTFMFYAKNRLGCIDSIRTTLTQPTALTSTFSQQSNKCYGDRTGTLELLGSGGTPDYAYSLDGGSFQQSPKFTELQSKTYSATIRDKNGCLSTSSITLEQPPQLAILPTYQDTIRCYGEKNGKVKVAAAGGTPTFLYSINGSDFFPNPEFSQLSVGSYKFYVKDANGCAATDSLILNQPDVIALTLRGKKDPLCFAGSDGTIEVMTTGGNGGYIYSLNNTVQQKGSLFTELSAASYQVLVTDRKGCAATLKDIVLTSPEKILSVFTTIKPNCFAGSDGTISVQVSGGTPDYQAVFDGKTFSAQNNQFVFASVESGTYPVEISDSHGCIDKLSVLVEQPSQLTLITNQTSNKCFGDKTGKIEVSGSGATPDYYYALNNSSFLKNGVFSNLAAGEYTVSVKDGKGCILTKTLKLDQPTAVSLTAREIDSVRCYGEKNGVVRLSARGGTPSYRYSLDGLEYYSDSTFKNLAGGAYRMWVKDMNACEQNLAVYIKQPEKLELVMDNKTEPFCSGDHNGMVVLKATGGNGQNVFWKDNSVKQVSNRFQGLGQGEFAFKVIDTKGCEAEIKTIELIWPKPLLSKIDWKGPTCSSDQDASVTVALSGGIRPYQVTSPSIDSPPVADNQDVYRFSNLESGKYVVISKDANGCISRSAVIIPASQELASVNFPGAEPVCKGQEVILDANNKLGNVRWFFNDQEISSARGDQKLTAVEPGAYKVIVTNQTGCSKSANYVLVNNNNALKADFLMTVQAFVGDTVTALDISQPTPDEIKWELPAEASVIVENGSKMAFDILANGEYEIKMIARKGECINTKIRSIKIFEKDDIDQTDSLLHYRDLNLIQEMIVYPNPNYGKFTVTIKLAKSENAVLTITRALNNVRIYEEEKKNEKVYVFEIDLKNFLQDVYIITVKAGKSIQYKRAVIMN